VKVYYIDQEAYIRGARPDFTLGFKPPILVLSSCEDLTIKVAWNWADFPAFLVYNLGDVLKWAESSPNLASIRLQDLSFDRFDSLWLQDTFNIPKSLRRLHLYNLHVKDDDIAQIAPKLAHWVQYLFLDEIYYQEVDSYLHLFPLLSRVKGLSLSKLWFRGDMGTNRNTRLGAIYSNIFARTFPYLESLQSYWGE
jgi:hypothetical protein